MKDIVYTSLSEAKQELEKRWNDQDLKRAVEKELGDYLLPQFHQEPHALLGRHLVSPDNGLIHFLEQSKALGIKPVDLEHLNDIFVSLNEEKKGLGRLRVVLEDGTKAFVDIIDFHNNERKPIKEVALRAGGSLVAFHRDLLVRSGYALDLIESESWFKNGNGRAANYYYPYLLHAVCHGVLFETFSTEESEAGFAEEVVIPTIEKIRALFKFEPLIVSLYPENQTDAEDFHWWSYPPRINSYIIKYARENGLTIKKYARE